MNAYDMEKTLSLARPLPWNPNGNPYDDEITIVVTTARAKVEHDRLARSAVTVRSARREAEIRALVHKVVFIVAFVSTGMLVGALIGLAAVGLYP